MRIEECFSAGWNAWKRDAAAHVLVTFALIVANFAVSAAFAWIHFPFNLVANALVSGLVSAGFMSVAQKGLRGETPLLGDAFAPCSARQGDYLLVGLATSAGALLCGVGVIATSVLFIFSPLLVVQGADYKDALRRSKDLVLAHLGEIVVLWLVVTAVNLVGCLLCGIGVLATLPISMMAVVKAYEQLTGNQGTVEVLPAT